MNKKILCLLMSVVMLLSGCSININIPNSDNNKVDSSISENSNTNTGLNSNGNAAGAIPLVSVGSIKEKYGYSDEMVFKPFYNVEQNTQFTFHFNSNVKPYQAITVHTDPKCGMNSTVYQINDGYVVEDGIDVVVKPGKPVLNTSDKKSGALENYNWGNAPIYYLCIRYDMNSKDVKKLDEPIIIPFTIRNNVSTPNLTCSISQDGVFYLNWKPVENAVKYNIYRAFRVRPESPAYNYTRSECGYVGDHLEKLTSVDARTLEFSDLKLDGTNCLMTSTDGYVFYQNSCVEYAYYITAEDANGNESAFSMAVEYWQYQNQLPHEVLTQQAFIRDSNYNITVLPESVPVKMSDGSTRIYPINYYKIKEEYGSAIYKYEVVGTKLTGEVKLTKNDKIYENTILSSVVNNAGLYNVKNSINIIPENTVNTISDDEYRNTVLNLDKIGTYDQSKKIVYTSEALYGRADIENARMINDGVYLNEKGPEGMFDYTSAEIIMPSNSNISTDVPTDEPTDEPTDVPTDEPTDVPTDEPITVPDEITSENLVEEQQKSTEKEVEEGNKIEIPTISYPIYADSAEEEYLALCFVNRIETIDLKAFPNLLDGNYLVDVFFKVHFQNPYHLGYSDIDIDYENKLLLLTYTNNATDHKEKQKAIYDESNRIINEIINDSMTDEEKIMAIWTYLEDNTKYDTAALETAEKNNFADVSGFEDSFNAYGIMCNKVGVCQSYAYTFKLLADLVGVESVVVTGYLGENMPHGWNAVKLGNTWYHIDTTNNFTNSGVPYLVYQTSTETLMGMSGYIIDNRFDIDTDLNQYASSDNTKDWYYSKNLMPTTVSDISKIIVRDVKSSGISIMKPYLNNMEIDELYNLGDNLYNELLNNGMSAEEANSLIFNLFRGLLIVH